MRHHPAEEPNRAVAGFPSPFGVSALASWVILRPLGSYACLTVGLPTEMDAPDPNGVVVLHMNKDSTGRGAPFTPGTVVRSQPATTLRPAPVAFQRPILGPADTSHRRGSPSRGVIGGSLAFTHHPKATGCRPEVGKRHWLPAGLLLARGPRMEREPLRLGPRASHPAVTRRARRGGDRPSRTGPSTYTYRH